ncbi:hypothetical protein BGS_0121 [Beggiatoa sp. SS]|nr:hypothetical protein BGS_0121 [Beggiatoa sp. SS]
MDGRSFQDLPKRVRGGYRANTVYGLPPKRLNIIAERFEGDFLACGQRNEKLGLYRVGGVFETVLVLKRWVNSAGFEFLIGWIRYLTGNGARCFRQLQSLRTGGGLSRF